jgi:hypothetical protein
VDGLSTAQANDRRHIVDGHIIPVVEWQALEQIELWRPWVVIMGSKVELKVNLNESTCSNRTDVQKIVDERPSSTSLFGRIAVAESHDPTVGGKHRNVQSAEKVVVEVRLEETCLRTVNGFSLYDMILIQHFVIRLGADCYFAGG